MPTRYVLRAIPDGVSRCDTMLHDASGASTGRLAAHRFSELPAAMFLRRAQGRDRLP